MLLAHYSVLQIICHFVRPRRRRALLEVLARLFQDGTRRLHVGLRALGHGDRVVDLDRDLAAHVSARTLAAVQQTSIRTCAAAWASISRASLISPSSSAYLVFQWWWMCAAAARISRICGGGGFMRMNASFQLRGSER